MEGKHEDQPRGGSLFQNKFSFKYFKRFFQHYFFLIFHLVLKVGLFKKWKQEQGRSKKQLKVKQENYDDEDEEENDTDEEDDDEDEQDEDENEVDEGKDIESNKKVSSKGEEDGDESDGYDEEEEDEDEDDYPEGATEYDPPDSLHSCTDITMTDRLLDRLKLQAHSGVLLQKKILTQKKLPFHTGPTQLLGRAQD